MRRRRLEFLVIAVNIVCASPVLADDVLNVRSGMFENKQATGNLFDVTPINKKANKSEIEPTQKSNADELTVPEDADTMTLEQVKEHLNTQAEQQHEHGRSMLGDGFPEESKKALPDSVRTGFEKSKQKVKEQRETDRRKSEIRRQLEQYREKMLRDALVKVEETKRKYQTGTVQTAGHAKRGPKTAPAKEYSADTAVLSLIVDASDHELLGRQVEQLVEYNKQLRVPLGKLLMVGFVKEEEKFYLNQLRELELGKGQQLNSISELPAFGSYEPPRSPAARIALNHNLYRSGMVDVENIYKRLQLKSLPAWVVRYHGVDYVIEGQANLKSFFGYAGEFLTPAHISRSSNVRIPEKVIPRFLALDTDSVPVVHVSESSSTGALPAPPGQSEYVFGNE